MDSKYLGNDNYGKPKQDYLDKLKAMDKELLSDETYDMIYHSARCANNQRADWHWKVDACYDEWERRGDNTGYKKAYEQVYRDHVGY